MTLRFIFKIKPQAKERPRQGRNKHTGQTMFFTPARTKKFEKIIRESAQHIMRCSGWIAFPKGTPLHATMTFSIGVKDPKKWGQYKTNGADTDNYIKAVLDSLNPRYARDMNGKRVLSIPGVAYYDDSQVVKTSAVKVYAEQDSISLSIEPMEQPA